MGKSIITVLIKGDSSHLDRELTGVQGTIGRWGRGLAAAGAAGAAAWVVFEQVVMPAIDAASNLNEAATASEQVFGPAADSIRAFAESAARNLGLSERAALQAATTFAVFGEKGGLEGDALVDFSKQFVELASDAASFWNTSPDEAVTAIGAAFRGEMEPIRRFGVLLDDATIKAKAMELGLYDGSGALTQQARLMATQASIMEQATRFTGDFTRTQDSLANQSRVLGAEWENLKADLGEELLPIAQQFVGWLIDDFIPALRGLGDEAQVMADAMKAGFDLVGPVIQGVLDVVLGVLAAFAALLRGDWSALWDAVKQILGGAWEAIKALFVDATVALVTIAVDGFAALLRAAGDGVMDLLGLIGQIPGWIGELLAGLALQMWNIGSDAMGGLWDGLKAVWGSVTGWLRGLGSDLWNALVGLVSIGSAIGSAIINAIKGAIQDAWSAFTGWLGGLVGDALGLLGLGGHEVQVNATILNGAGAAMGAAPLAAFTGGGGDRSFGRAGTTIVLQLDGRTLAQAVVDESRLRGGLPIVLAAV